MTYITKISAILGILFLFQSCIIGGNTKAEDCIIKKIKVASIYEGGVKDIVFEEANGDFYYINRGLEQGLTLEGLEKKLLNKEITLHVFELWFGVESEHISRLALGDEIVFSEF